jgi:hypothetical protein
MAAKEDKSKMKFKTNIGAAVFRTLFKDAEFREAKRNIFKGNCAYDFDVDADFGDSLPKLVIRNKDKTQYEERFVIPVVNPSIHSRMLKVVPYIIEGKKVEKKKPVEKKLEKVLHPREEAVAMPGLFSDDEDM